MKILFLISLIVLCLSCKEDLNNNKKTAFRTFITDSSITHGGYNELEFSKNLSDFLHLPYIFKGVDSFELRISSSGMWTVKDLFVLRFYKGKWLAADYAYYGYDFLDSMHVIGKEISNDTAQKVSNYLCQDSILQLPSQFAIPGFKDNTADGETYHIEISTNKFYKILEYHNPKYFKDNSNRRFTQLLIFLSSYLKLYFST